MSNALFLVLAVAVAYLAARVLFDWLARRFLIVSGAEYLLLGILLGPQLSGLLSTEALEGFAPLTILALGWIGAIVGMQFFVPGLVKLPGNMYRLAFFEALITLGLVTGVMLVTLSWAFGMTHYAALVPAVAMGAIATVSAPAGIQMVARRLGQRGPVVKQLEIATAVDALVGVSAIGLLFALRRPAGELITQAITVTEWAVISIGLGIIGGVLFHLFLGEEHDSDRLFISLAGAIILVSGAAAYLALSPMFAAMVMGTTLINTSRARTDIAQTLSHAERPFYFVLLVFAGATWQPVLDPWWVMAVTVFLICRVAAKVGGARLAARTRGALPVLGPDWGRALLGQGGLALALGLNYLQFRQGVLGDVVFTAVIASVLLTDVASARIARSVLAPLTMGAVAETGERPAPAGAGSADSESTEPEARAGGRPMEAEGG